MAPPGRVANRSRRRRFLAWGSAIGLAISLAVVIAFWRPLFQGNFGEVEAGRVYRSAQPREELATTIQSRGLASILNLRGGSDRDDWYVAEVREADRRGVDFYDLPMSATKRPSRRELLTLVDLFGRCRYPLLIHCKAGSDRTGLAVALYRLSQLGWSPSEANRSFSIEFGHVPFLGPEHLHEPIDEYEKWLNAHKLDHSPDRFLGWVQTSYRDSDPIATAIPLRPGPRDRIANARSSSAIRISR